MSRHSRSLLSGTVLSEPGAPQFIVGESVVESTNAERAAVNNAAIARMTSWQRIRWQRAGAEPDLATHYAAMPAEHWHGRKRRES